MCGERARASCMCMCLCMCLCFCLCLCVCCVCSCECWCRAACTSDLAEILGKPVVLAHINVQQPWCQQLLGWAHSLELSQRQDGDVTPTMAQWANGVRSRQPSAFKLGVSSLLSIEELWCAVAFRTPLVAVVSGTTARVISAVAVVVCWSTPGRRVYSCGRATSQRDAHSIHIHPFP